MELGIKTKMDMLNDQFLQREMFTSMQRCRRDDDNNIL